MKNQTIIIHLIVSCFLLVNSVHVNSQFIVKQTSHEIPFVYSLIPEDVEFVSEEDEIEFMLNVSMDELITAATEEGYEISKENTISYFDGDNFAVETNSEETGKITMISEVATGNMFIIMWAEQMILEVGPDDFKKVQEQTKEAVEEVIKDMPPDQQEAVRAEMLKESESIGASFPTIATGKTAEISNFHCEEYRVQVDDETKSIWVTQDTQGLLEAVDMMANGFDALFEMNEEQGYDEWQLIPGKIPVQVKSFSLDMMMGEPVIFVETITQIKKEKPAAEVFQIPDEVKGFTRSSYLEMMQKMMEAGEDY